MKKYSTETEKDCDLIIRRYELGEIKIIETREYNLVNLVIIILILIAIFK